jgi:hypothetical protein
VLLPAGALVRPGAARNKSQLVVAEFARLVVVIVMGVVVLVIQHG